MTDVGFESMLPRCRSRHDVNTEQCHVLRLDKVGQTVLIFYSSINLRSQSLSHIISSLQSKSSSSIMSSYALFLVEHSITDKAAWNSMYANKLKAATECKEPEK